MLMQMQSVSVSVEYCRKGYESPIVRQEEVILVTVCKYKNKCNLSGRGVRCIK